MEVISALFQRLDQVESQKDIEYPWASFIWELDDKIALPVLMQPRPFRMVDRKVCSNNQPLLRRPRRWDRTAGCSRSVRGPRRTIHPLRWRPFPLREPSNRGIPMPKDHSANFRYWRESERKLGRAKQIKIDAAAD